MLGQTFVADEHELGGDATCDVGAIGGHAPLAVLLAALGAVELAARVVVRLQARACAPRRLPVARERSHVRVDGFHAENGQRRLDRLLRLDRHLTHELCHLWRSSRRRLADVLIVTVAVFIVVCCFLFFFFFFWLLVHRFFRRTVLLDTWCVLCLFGVLLLEQKRLECCTSLLLYNHFEERI